MYIQRQRENMLFGRDFMRLKEVIYRSVTHGSYLFDGYLFCSSSSTPIATISLLQHSC